MTACTQPVMEGKSMSAKTPFVFFGLQVVLAELLGVFGLIIQLQYDVKWNHGKSKVYFMGQCVEL